MRATRRVIDDGIFINYYAYPAVPRQRCGIRLTITQNPRKEDISAV
jgi:7-keto-8-aminopelargonate synthetase-like enzyme